MKKIAFYFRAPALFAAAFVICLLTAMESRAGSDTWTGGAAPDGNWQTPANWGGTAPVADDFLFFDGSSDTAATNNFANGTVFECVDFNSTAGAFTLWPVNGGDGSGLVVTNPAASTSLVLSGGGITNLSPNNEAINLPVTLSAGNHVIATASGAGGLSFGGAFGRNPDATVQFVKGGGNIGFSSLGLVNGIIGGYATIGLGLNAGDWATVSGGNVAAYSSYTTKSGGTSMALSSSGGNAANNIKINTRSSTASTLNGTTSGTYDINTLLWNTGSTPSGDQTLNISSGQTLRLGANGAIMNVHSDNRTFNVGNSTSTSAITAGGAANTAGELSLYSVSFANGSARLQIKSPITDNGTGKVSVNTLGDVQFNLADTYSGGTFINIGRVWANTTSGFGTGPVYIYPGGEAALNTGGTFANNFYIWGYGSSGIGDPLVIRQTSSSVTLSGTITLESTAILGPNGNSMVVSGNITGPGGLRVLGAYANGSLHLDESTPNSYAGDTTIDALGLDNDTGHSIAIWIDNPAHNNIMPNGSGAGNMNLYGGATALAQFDVGGTTQTINGLGTSNGSPAEALVTSNPGGGTLNVGGNDATSEYDGVIGTLGGNGTVNININKIGMGTLALGGINNYTGTTTVTAGTLSLNGGSISASSQITANGGAVLDVSQTSFTLASGQTLTGAGSVNGDVNTAGGSTITSPAGSVLTFSNNLTLNTGNVCAFTLSSTTNGANSQLVVDGGITLAGATIQITAPTLQLGRYRLILYSGSESGTVAGNLSLNYVPNGATVVLDDSIPNEIDLLVTPGVPETLTWKGDNSLNVWDVNTTFDWTTNGFGSFVFTNGCFAIFNDLGSKSPAVNLSAVVQPASLLVSNNSGTYTFSSAGGGSISGGTGLVKNGAGALVLTETGDSFTGGIVVSNGSLMIDNDSSGVSGGMAIAATASVQLGNADSLGVLPAGQITNNGTLTFNHPDDITVANVISGSGGLVKTNTDTVTLSAVNSFTGGAIITDGTLRGWTASALGATNGTIVVNNGATLDRGWSAVGPIIASGAGVGGAGALVNNSTGNAIYDGGAGGLTPSLTLTGDLTMGGNTRMDLGGTAGAVVSTGGNNYGITVNFASGIYQEWDNLTIDTNLGDINVETQGGGSLGIKGCGLSLGNPTNTITVYPGSSLTFWGEATNNSGYSKNIHVMTNATVSFRPQNPNIYYNSTLVLDDGATMSCFNGAGTIGTAMMGTISLGGLVHLQVGDSAVTFSNVVSGTGGFYLDNFNNTLVFAATNTYSGITDLRAGRILALTNNGSISQSTNISLARATLSASGRTDGTLTLASGQTLQTVTNGTVAGMFATVPGSVVAPGGVGAIGTLTVSSNVTLAGTLDMDVDPANSTNDALVVSGSGASITYGGTLNVGSLDTNYAAGQSFKLFNAAAYSGAFAAITPSTPAPGLAWDTSSLAVDGTLGVVGVQPPVFTSITLTGTTLTLGASNGLPNGPVVLLTSTNVAGPWIPWLTNAFDTNGNLSLSTNIVPPHAQQYFILSQ